MVNVEQAMSGNDGLALLASDQELSMLLVVENGG